MKGYGSGKRGRRSIRLRGWDYRSPALYFVTICTHERHCLFENPDFKEIAIHALNRIPEQKHAQHVLVDKSVVMPNHAHVVFDFVNVAMQADLSKPIGTFENALAGSLGVVVGRYKTAASPGCLARSPLHGRAGGEPRRRAGGLHIAARS